MKRYICFGCIITGAVFMLYGLFQGEAVNVFEKAVEICLECIGIG